MHNSQDLTAAARAGQEYFIAETDETGLGAVDAVQDESAPTSQWGEAWRALRRRPPFWVSALLILFAILLALVPGLFTSVDPRECMLSRSLGTPEPGHPFGFDRQGCDINARTIFGARASVTVGVLTTIVVTILGSLIGAIAGFYGGIWDTLLSRLTDIFFAVPLVLAAIVVMSMFQNQRSIWMVVFALSMFGWTQIARIARGAERRADHLLTHPAERGCANHCVRHRRVGHVYRRRSDPVVPRYRFADDSRVVGRRHFRCAGISEDTANGAVLPCNCFGTDGAELHHDG